MSTDLQKDLDIRLSPLDIAFIGDNSYKIHIGLFFDEALDVDRLKSSLTSLSKSYWFLSSNLLSKGEDFFYLDQYNSREIQFSLIESELSIQSDLNEIRKDLAAFPDVDNIPGSSLCTIGLLKMKDGCCLSIKLAHCIADGYSLFLFLSSLSSIYSSSDPNLDNLISPIFSREDINKECYGGSSIGRRKDGDIHLGFSYSEKRHIEPSKYEWTRYQYSISSLKELVKDEESDSELFSIHEILTALLWRKHCSGNFGGESYISIAADQRRKFRGRKTQFFGNLSRLYTSKIESEFLHEMTIPQIVKFMRANTANVEKESFGDFLSHLNSIFESNSPSNLEVAEPINGLMITNLTDLKFHRLKFGAAAPTNLCFVFPSPRTAVISRSAVNPDCIYADICWPIKNRG